MAYKADDAGMEGKKAREKRWIAEDKRAMTGNPYSPYKGKTPGGGETAMQGMREANVVQYRRKRRMEQRKKAGYK